MTRILYNIISLRVFALALKMSVFSTEFDAKENKGDFLYCLSAMKWRWNRALSVNFD